jgi:hypothetical protein
MKRAISSFLFALTFAAGLHAEKHALLIGISVYNQESGVPALDGPRHDVEALRGLLTSSMGFPEDNVKVLQDQDATFVRILSELNGLKKRVKPGDYVVFYYSGHGTSYGDPAARTWGLDPNTGAILPWDIKVGTPDEVRAKLILGKQHLRPVFSALDSVATVFAIFDTCYSADAAKSIRVQRTRYVPLGLLAGGASRGLRSVNDLDADLATMAARQDPTPFPYHQVISLAAAGKFQPACDISAEDVRRHPELTFDHQPHGVLTDALMRGMKGAADKNRDGVVTHDELYSYLLEASVNWSHRPVLQASADAKGILKGAAFQAVRPPAPDRQQQKETGKFTEICIKAEQLRPEVVARITGIAGVKVSDSCGSGLIVRPANAGGFDLFQASGIAINSDALPEDKLLARIAAEPEVQQLLNLGSEQKMNLDLRIKPDDKSVYTGGSPIGFEVRTNEPAFLLMLNIDTTGAVTVVYPYQMLILRNQANQFEPIGAGGQVSAPFGIEYMKLFAFREKPAGLEKWNATGDDKPITVEPGSAKFRELMQMVRAGKPVAETRTRLVTAPGLGN